MPLGLSGSGLITGFDPTASGFGKVLQVVRATDTTSRSTTSATYVDANISVSISPQVSTSNLIVIYVGLVAVTGTSGVGPTMRMAITDSSNVFISATEGMAFASTTANEAITAPMTLIGYVSAGSTSARTYKVLYTSTSSFRTAEIINSHLTGQLFAIEVSA